MICYKKQMMYKKTQLDIQNNVNHINNKIDQHQTELLKKTDDLKDSQLKTQEILSQVDTKIDKNQLYLMQKLIALENLHTNKFSALDNKFIDIFKAIQEILTIMRNEQNNTTNLDKQIKTS